MPKYNTVMGGGENTSLVGGSCVWLPFLFYSLILRIGGKVRENISDGQTSA